MAGRFGGVGVARWPIWAAGGPGEQTATCPEIAAQRAARGPTKGNVAAVAVGRAALAALNYNSPESSCTWTEVACGFCSGGS